MHETPQEMRGRKTYSKVTRNSVKCGWMDRCGDGVVPSINISWLFKLQFNFPHSIIPIYIHISYRFESTLP